ncbi:MAG: hypothetical protein ABL917_02890 [Parcubacteria group bacterium]
MNKYTYILIALLFVGGVVWLFMTPGKPGKYDGFAQCIKNTKTVTFFGAFWCPHCNEQKKRFGKSAKYLPYVECSTPDGKDRLPVCVNANITTYPTWDFATSSIMASTTRITGEMELVDLAEKTGCALPQ